MANYSNCSSVSAFKSFTPQTVDYECTFSDLRNQHGVQNKNVTLMKDQKRIERVVEAFECHAYMGYIYIMEYYSAIKTMTS